jgi:hypothetical protein
LTPARQAVLKLLVHEHLATHGGDVEIGLAAAGGPGAFRGVSSITPPGSGTRHRWSWEQRPSRTRRLRTRVNETVQFSRSRPRITRCFPAERCLPVQRSLAFYGQRPP